MSCCRPPPGVRRCCSTVRPSAAAALVAARLAFRAADWWLAGNLSPDPAHALALARLSLEPVLDLGLRGDDGTGALLAVPVLRAAVGAETA